MQRRQRLVEGKERRTRRMRLNHVKRRWGLTFQQCRRIIKLFISGLSIEKMVERTGLQRAKILRVLYVTRRLLLQDLHRSRQRLAIPHEY